ncbi:MAG: undecaprenyldiphospho-muramoylpentapeptide beta-N-acetylglucosaminyltransferase [Proteobacteria bacterium]|nr:undecaprenyldiphospho-muramoylpentapeptide beta-N-acetylglucosaminyltransferase [Pseudomonadota bacterium]MDE3208363.1 undecaprenyldiphospho-muramoylpentapeptide beta-N-acetylglucosaminyltransferase [Pseudomonadota bacterium]
MTSRTILIMAGGTGGHVFPALAIADALKQEGWRIIWLGSLKGIEARLIPQAGYPIFWIKFAGLRGKGVSHLIMLPWRLITSLLVCVMLIFRERPHVVLGMGGYVSFPGGLAALFLRCPLIIHEQNAIAGMVNRVCSKWADRVLLGYPNALHGPRNKIEVTGNPVRNEILKLGEPVERYALRTGALNILVVGGSLGARALNELMPQAMALLAETGRPRICHQTGKLDYEQVRLQYRQAAIEAEVVPFIENMAEAYAFADLVICRSGALTVAELAAAGVAGLLVPYPYAVDDHQTANARYLSDKGAALILDQKGLTPAGLAELIESMTRENLKHMAILARKLARPDAVKHIAKACIHLVDGVYS